MILRMGLLLVILYIPNSLMADIKKNESSGFINTLYAYTLDGKNVEFYEAYIVSNENSSIEEVIDDLERLCVSFRDLGRYRIRVFSNPKYATKKGAKELSSGKVKLDDNTAKNYIADYHPERKILVVYPLVSRLRKSMDVELCARNKQ